MAGSAARRRVRLAPPALVLGVVAALLLMLAAFFPWHGVFAREGRTDAVSLAYRRVLLAARPDDAPLRLALAADLHRLGRPGEARETLRPLLDSQDAAGREARALDFEVRLDAWRALAPGSPERREGRDDVERALAELVRDAPSPEVLDRLTDIALELGRPQLASQLQLEVAARPPSPVGPFACGADASCHARRAIELAQATNDREHLLGTAARALEIQPESPQVLRAAVAAAAAQGALEQRVQWTRAWASVEATPEVLSMRLEAELAAGRLDEALEVATALRDRQPDAAERWERVARLAEWSGRPALALETWAEAERRGLVAESDGRARRLAMQLGATAKVRDVLLAKARSGALARDERRLLFDAIEATLRPGEAAAAMRSYLARHPNDRAAWESLAALHERAGELWQALTAHDEMLRRFGDDAALAMRGATLLWRLGDVEGALGRLEARRESAGAHEAEFWRLLGELAWVSERDELATAAYERLFAADDSDRLAGERLLALAQEARNTESTARVAHALWRNHREPRFLVVAMSAARRGGDWAKLGWLVAQARRDPSAFDGEMERWLSESDLAWQEGRLRRGVEMARRAHQAAPHSTQVAALYLWRALDARDPAMLAEAVARTEPAGAASPALRRPLALANDRLGHGARALHWYAQAARDGVDEPWLLAWTSALERQGQAATAWELRRTLWRRRTDAKDPGAQDLALVRHVSGIDRADELADRLEPLAATDARVREGLVSQWIRDGRFDRVAAFQQAHPDAPLAPWQALELAVATDDRDEVRRLVTDAANELPAADRVRAARRAGLTALARQIARDPGALTPGEREALARELELLRAMRRGSLDASLEASNNALVDDRLARVAIRLPGDEWRPRAGIDVRERSPHAVPGLPPGREWELHPRVGVEWSDRHASAYVEGGVNVREHDALVQVSGRAEGEVHPGVRVGVEGHWNDLDELPPLLQLVGARRALQLDATLRWRGFPTLRGSVSGESLVLRDGRHVASGVLGGVELEQVLLRAPLLGVRLRAGGLAIPLVGDEGAATLAGVTTPVSAATQGVVFAQLGGPRLQARVDLWSAMAWPQSALALGGALELSTRLATSTELALYAGLGHDLHYGQLDTSTRFALFFRQAIGD